MAFGYPFLLVSVLWILSEIILARLTYSHSERSRDLDRSSIKYLWIAIVVSTTCGLLLGFAGLGLVKSAWKILSTIGLALILIGLVLRWTAILTLRRDFTVNISLRDNQMLVTDGIYRYLRHPSYAGSLLSFLGLGLAFANWLSTAIIFLPVLFAFLRRIKLEEEALHDHFGTEYEDYCRKTSRLFVGIY
jgi:protein-S-isoprenylcysteine O-methyltransferase Ste14